MTWLGSDHESQRLNAGLSQQPHLLRQNCGNTLTALGVKIRFLVFASWWTRNFTRTAFKARKYFGFPHGYHICMDQSSTELKNLFGGMPARQK